MPWLVLEHPDFSSERESFPPAVLEKLAEGVLTLAAVGPQLGRPLVDTLNGSKHGNMKKMRFRADGVWRIAFAFDEERNAVLLVGANKEGADQKRFYKALIRTADARFDDWLETQG